MLVAPVAAAPLAAPRLHLVCRYEAAVLACGWPGRPGSVRVAFMPGFVVVWHNGRRSIYPR